MPLTATLRAPRIDRRRWHRYRYRPRSGRPGAARSAPCCPAPERRQAPASPRAGSKLAPASNCRRPAPELSSMSARFGASMAGHSCPGAARCHARPAPRRRRCASPGPPDAAHALAAGAVAIQDPFRRRRPWPPGQPLDDAQQIHPARQRIQRDRGQAAGAVVAGGQVDEAARRLQNVALPAFQAQFAAPAVLADIMEIGLASQPYLLTSWKSVLRPARSRRAPSPRTRPRSPRVSLPLGRPRRCRCAVAIQDPFRAAGQRPPGRGDARGPARDDGAAGPTRLIEPASPVISGVCRLRLPPW